MACRGLPDQFTIPPSLKASPVQKGVHCSSKYFTQRGHLVKARAVQEEWNNLWALCLPVLPRYISGYICCIREVVTLETGDAMLYSIW